MVAEIFTGSVTTQQRANWIKSAAFLERNKGLIGRSSFYEGIRCGSIPHVRVGKLILVPEDAIDRMHQTQRSPGT